MKNVSQHNPFIFNCETCCTKCEGTSKNAYIFDEDAEFSSLYEQKLINYINQYTNFKAEKTTDKSYPDVRVLSQNKVVFYIEVKVQRRTFMAVQKYLPQSNLKPSETIALNESDLLRYFEIGEKIKEPIFLFWVLLSRPCILKEREEKYYYRLVSELKPIWEKERDKRKFKRKSGEGDEVNGKHLGVTVNYHFSLNELKNWQKVL